MKITVRDVKALSFASMLIGQVKEQTVEPEQRNKLEVYQHRVRKCYLVLLNCYQSPSFDLVQATTSGIPDNSVVANGIRSLTPKAEDNLRKD